MNLQELRKLIREEVTSYLKEDSLSDLYVKQLVDKYGKDKSRDFLLKQANGAANLEGGKKVEMTGKFRGYLNALDRMYGKPKTEALTNPREPVHTALKAEPILNGAEDYIYNLVKKFGKKNTLDHIKSKVIKPGRAVTPSIKNVYKNYLNIFKQQDKKGLYTDFKESIRPISAKILKEEKIVDPTLANAISKIKSHISSIRDSDKKKFAQAYLEYCLTGEHYPTPKEFEIPEDSAATIKTELHNMWTTAVEK